MIPQNKGFLINMKSDIQRYYVVSPAGHSLEVAVLEFMSSVLPWAHIPSCVHPHTMKPASLDAEGVP